MMGMEELFGTVVHSLVDEGATGNGKSGGGRTRFQWGGTVFAIVLLIINSTERRSRHITTLLVLFLFTSFPEALFKILRGQFGCWVAFLAILARLFFPETFSMSRFLLFVITPDWIAHGLRGTMGGIIFCLITNVLLVIIGIREYGGIEDCRCNFRCFFYFLCTSFLFFFTVEYLCLEI